ncbi:MAG: hypothetical protein A3A43_01220 [Candidatus Liptonbacteria bacterium RIFCSPLOWO2_01_FULL_56_20]|uniref:LTD domain-containing protein n=1 Tax=Candidatus Liptonbacteria bacterium RIFCSPLOWO2_01_FULL_56_20 TaxID=1798652 RepID=A0A1G2CJ38_9BACT|nr:MAG: hypothetical protein A3A43_01220 [Candidatus Liptonbacteria bacterium RIFCSPLOWO2_01_FULL_56_20]
MVFINEWLPNPSGADIEGEWVELWNDGVEAVGLYGWALQSGNGKAFVLGSRAIGAGDYLVLRRSETKLTLRNQGERLVLVDAQGRLVHEASFLGSAPEGKSVSRMGDRFIFSDPTPGEANSAAHTALLANDYPAAAPLQPAFSSGEFLLLLFVCAAALAVLALFFIKRNENLSQLFFGRH